jgi:hypothetical protein
MMCFESPQLACSSKEKLFLMPHAKFARFWLMLLTAVTARRYKSTTQHLSLLPTHPEKRGPISLLFDLLEQSKVSELALRALRGPKLGAKIPPSWNLTRRCSDLAGSWWQHWGGLSPSHTTRMKWGACCNWLWPQARSNVKTGAILAKQFSQVSPS